MERLRNLKERICSYENIMGAYRDAAKGKRYRGQVLEFSFHLGENLLSIQRDLENMTYQVGPYREFYVRYPKPRLVMALGFRDRVVQWAIYRQINPFLDKRYIAHSYGCRVDKGTLAAAQCLHNWQKKISRKPDAGEWYIVKLDIRKYFYRVDHEKVLETYESVADDQWFLWLMGTIINNPDVPFGLPSEAAPDRCPRDQRLYHIGMPIGNLTSQETANLLLDRMDKHIKHVLKVHDYVRYVDDFCLAVKGKENAWRAYREIERYLQKELRLELSPKSRVQKATAPVEFVGFLITPHGIRIRKKTTTHVKRSLKLIMALFASGKIGYDRAMESAICYLGMCKNVNGHNLARWIQENFFLQRNDAMCERERLPENGRHFYSIIDNGDGTADVYLRPDGETGCILVVQGVEQTEGLESDIRERFYGWCASGEPVPL